MKKILNVSIFDSEFFSFGQDICATCGPDGLQNNRTNITGGNENTSSCK